MLSTDNLMLSGSFKRTNLTPLLIITLRLRSSKIRRMPSSYRPEYKKWLSRPSSAKSNKTKGLLSNYKLSNRRSNEPSNKPSKELNKPSN